MAAQSSDITARPSSIGNALASCAAKLLTRGSQRGLLTLTFVFLVLGNLPRFLPIAGFRQSQNILELVLLFAGVCTALLNPRIARLFVNRWLPVWAIILGSCVYGTLLNGFAAGPVMYAVRLVLLLLAAFAVGYCLKARFGADIAAVLAFATNAFLLVALVGLVQLFVFPDLWVLWRQLAEFGVTFHGDPHHRRLVSTYFDPNFYSVIGSLYLVAAFVLWRSQGSLLRAGAVWLIVLTILLSGSRAGIGTLCGMVLATAWVFRQPILRATRTLVISRQTASFGMLTIAATILGTPLYLRSVLRMWSRLMIIGEDLSAQSRFDSFRFGLELLEKHPLLGMGYNYHSPLVVRFNGLTTLDSSLLVTLVSFGVIFTALLLLVLVKWAVRTRAKLAAWEAHEASFRIFFDLFLWYLAIVILFSAQTINAVYHPLWLLPMVIFGSYLTLLPWPEDAHVLPADEGHRQAGDKTP